MTEQWFAYDEAMQKAGIVVSSEALELTGTATTVRVEGGERIVTDGPHAKTPVAFGGFYVIDVPDRATALDWAARSPAAADGLVEVRPVMLLDA